MKKLLKNLVLVVVMAALIHCQPKDQTNDTINLDEAIIDAMRADNIPAVSACVIKDEGIVWEKSYGVADMAADRPATWKTIYRLASISKLVLVTAVMQLVEQGLIDLDEDIGNYLPFPIRNPGYPAQKVTTRMLLTHTSGLAWPVTDNEIPYLYEHFPPDSAPSLAQWIPQFLLPGGDRYVSWIWKNTSPGEQALYSNIGTSLAAYLVEVVSGLKYTEYCDTNIFGPLEMNNTGFLIEELNPEHLVTLYLENYEPHFHYSVRPYPAGSLYSSIEDFSHFIAAYINEGTYKGKQLFNRDTFNDILTVYNQANGQCLIWKKTIGGWFGHAGGTDGVSSYAEFQREDGVGLIIFSNKKNRSVYPSNQEIYSLIRREANKYRN